MSPVTRYSLGMGKCSSHQAKDCNSEALPHSLDPGGRDVAMILEVRAQYWHSIRWMGTVFQRFRACKAGQSCNLSPEVNRAEATQAPGEGV